MRRRSTILVALSTLALAATTGHAQNLLFNGDFEAAAGMTGWTLEETVTGMPGAIVDSAGQVNFANQPEVIDGEFGLWLKGFSGNIGPFDGENVMTNAVLSQTVPGVAEETYTMTGWARFEPNYSGGVLFLDELSPTGQAGGDLTSPTQSIFELAFLDSGTNVIGTPVTLNLRDDAGQFGDNDWYQHTLMGTAPEGTANVRVTAAAYDMVYNIEPMQSGMYDNFSLTGASDPATELLANANLNEPPPEFPGWTVIELPEGTNTIAPASFANNPATGGSVGAWLRGFAEGDAILSQTVAGIPGGEYTFSLWSAWEQFYSGGMPDTTTENFMELAFLDGDEDVIGEPLRLDLLDAGQTNAPGPVGQNPEAWQQFSLNGTAPEGTAFVQVSAGAIGMFNTEGAQSAFLDDLMLTLATVGLPGDFNNDGVVDAADYTVWRDGLGTEFTSEQYNEWKGNFGATAVGSGAALVASAVPEPTSAMLMLMALAFGAGACRRRSAQ